MYVDGNSLLNCRLFYHYKQKSFTVYFSFAYVEAAALLYLFIYLLLRKLPNVYEHCRVFSIIDFSKEKRLIILLN